VFIGFAERSIRPGTVKVVHLSDALDPRPRVEQIFIAATSHASCTLTPMTLWAVTSCRHVLYIIAESGKTMKYRSRNRVRRSVPETLMPNPL